MIARAIYGVARRNDQVPWLKIRGFERAARDYLRNLVKPILCPDRSPDSFGGIVVDRLEGEVSFCLIPEAFNPVQCLIGAPLGKGRRDCAYGRDSIRFICQCIQ